MKISISAPFHDLIKASKTGRDEFPAQLTLSQGDLVTNFEIKLSPRGLSRRTLGICTFPPLKVDFKKKQVRGTLFHGQNKLKLVTHCQKSNRYQDFYIKEYDTYRALNVLTPMSFQVRMAEVTYIDTTGKDDTVTKYGFFIEDIDDVAERNGMEELEVEKIDVGNLEPVQATIYALFQYFIGNLDWSNTQGPEGEDCCHNSKLIAKGGIIGPGSVYAIPYDFDFSGLVDAPYAVPPEEFHVRNVRQRLFRGFCRHNDDLDRVVSLFLEKEPGLRAVFADEPLLPEGEKAKILKYVDDFFETLKDPKKVGRKIRGKCVS